jgi:outer membrane murein-binding lipoprotein Lpp
VNLDNLKEVAQWMPFLAMVRRNPNEPTGPWSHQLTVRLLEAAIIGGVVLWGTVQTTQAKIDHMTQQLSQVREDVAEMRQQLRSAEQELWRRKGLDKLVWQW